MNIPAWLVVAPAAVFGLVIGSFLNVVAVRVPRGESVIRPPSHCMHCGHRLGALDLIPVLGYIVLGGRCRYCRSRISPAYPAGEIATAAAFAMTAWRVGWTPELIAGLLLASVLIVAAQTDLRTLRIPDRIVVFALGAGLAARIVSHPLPWWDYALGSVLGAGILLMLAVISRGGMGGGDIKLYLFVGMMLGFKLTLMSIFAASLLGSLYGLGLMLAGRFRPKMALPFGPFIAAGSLAALWFGNGLIGWYLALLD